MEEQNHKIYLDKAIEVAKVAGEMIKKAFYSEKIVESKGVADIVTETDKKVEEFIFTTLGSSFPSHKFLGEETHSSSKSSGYNWGNEPTWIVDPIDGTTNFVARLPFVCVSIGLAIQKKVVLGVIYNPILEELFWAMRGSGAFLNGKLIHVSTVTNMESAVIATNVGYDRTPQGIAFMLSNLKNLLDEKVRSIRMGGSAAMDMAGVACGRLECFYECGVHPWDIAAASVIVEEAGGIVLDPFGEAVDLESRRVLTGHKDFLPLVIKVLEKTPIPEKYPFPLKTL